jgi:hypothetical protein
VKRVVSMATVQGEFATAVQAEVAVEGLKAAGAAAADIRIWNVIPEAKPSEPGTTATKAGGLSGALLGGVRGYVAGAALGGVLDSVSREGSHLADPTGIRIVVEVSASCSDPAALLRELGAVNVR